MNVQRANREDVDAILGFDHDLIERMRGSAYRPTWETGVNPTREGLLDAAEAGTLYFAREDDAVVGAFVHNQSICIFTKENFLQFSFAGKKLNDLEQAHIPDAVFEFGDTCFVTVGSDGCWRVTVE